MSSALIVLALAGCKQNLAFDPIADAGLDQMVALGTTTVVDGAASADLDGLVVAYEWTLLAAPDGSAAVLGSAGSEAQLNPDVLGTYTLSLTVEDDDGNRSSPDIVNVTAVDSNEAPTAVLATLGTPGVGVALELTGEGSWDPEGDPLSYWFSVQVAPTASTATIEQSPDSPQATFTADVEGFYVLGLEVDDGYQRSTRMDLEFYANGSGTNGPPVADCGTPQEVIVGSPADFNGTGSSDPNGDALTFSWELFAPEGSTTSLDDPSSDRPAFTVDVPGTFRGELTVSDGALEDRCATTVTAAGGENGRPVAHAGTDVTGDPGERLEFDASRSYDPDGDALDFQWQFVAVPSDSGITLANLSAPETQTPAFTPDVGGTYVLQVAVCDQEPLCDVDTVSAIVSGGTGNNPPVADAGRDQSGNLGDTLTADGSGSSDPDGDSLTYTWTLTAVPSGSGLTTSDLSTSGATASLRGDVEGDYTVQLEVCDPSAACDSDTAVLTLSPIGTNNPPVADAGADMSGSLGASVSVDGSASYDPDGDAITYTWGFNSVPSGSSITASSFSDRTASQPSFTPDVAGTYVARLRVSDGTDNDNDTVSITITDPGTNTAPVADAGADQSVTTGSTATADGTGSSDADGDPLTYLWGFNSVPAGSSVGVASLSDRTAVSPSFTPDVDGTYVLRLVVDDGTDNDRDTVRITASGGGGGNTPPLADAGSDVTVCGVSGVDLDGTASSDPDGDTIGYAWTFSSVPSASSLVNGDITGRTTATPSFEPDAEGTFTLQLTVNDGTDSSTDLVDVDTDDNDMALMLHLDDASGSTAMDGTFNANDGSLLNSDWDGGYLFGSLLFDTSEIVTVAYDSSLDLSNDWTIEWWMKSSESTAGYQTVFVRGSSARYDYTVWKYDDFMYFYGLTSAGSYAYVVANALTFDGDWHHYAITMNSSNVVTWYEDGTSMATGTATGALASSSTSDLEIGGWSLYAGYYGFEGEIDEFLIHESALSASEVSARVSTTTQVCTGDSDSDAPTATITSPSSGTASEGVVAIEGTASDDSEIVSVTVGGSTAIATSANFATWVAYVELADGSNTVSVSAEDVAGNAASGLDSITLSWSDTCLDDYELFLAFDEDAGAGTGTDYSANANDATESGTDRVFGAYGNGAVFDGSSAYATVAHDSSISYRGGFTADFWYRRDGTTSDIEVLFHKGVYNYAAALDGDDIYCLVRDSSSTDYVATATGFNDGDWHHVVCVYNRSNIRIIVDGVVEDNTTAGSPLDTNSDDLTIGSAAGAAYFFTGELDELRIRDGALGYSALLALYGEGEVCAFTDNFAASGTADESGSLSVNYTGDNVIDGDLSEDAYADETFWLLPTGTTGWVEVDLGAVKGVTRLRWANTHYGPRYSAATRAYEIYGSATGEFNGEEELIESGSGSLETDLRYHQVDLSTPVAAQYVRFYVDSYYSAGGGINELEVYGVE